MLKVNVYFGTIIYGKLNFILTDMQQDMIYFIIQSTIKFKKLQKFVIFIFYFS